MHLEQLISAVRSTRPGSGRIESGAYGAPNIDHLTRLDQEADTIRAFDHMVIPGLLQVPSYSRAVIQASSPRLPHQEVRRRMLLKAARAESFQRKIKQGGAYAFFVVGEQALYHKLGDIDAHRLQLRHLASIATWPRLSVRVLRSGVLPPGLTSHLLLWGFPEEADPEDVSRSGQPCKRLAYSETAVGGCYSTCLEDLSTAFVAFSDLQMKALGDHDSLTLLRELIY